jgi:predicted NUDIX family phosphoesterase
VGIINDDSNSVGAVHVGVVQVVTVTGTVAIRETDRLEGRMVSMEDLRVLRDQGADFETWSALLLDRLEEFLPQPVTQTSEREPIRTS